jgi:hypothetical protein
MSIEKILCMSTGHITYESAQDLSLGIEMAAIEDPNERPEEIPEWVNQLIVYPHGEYGWLIFVNEAKHDEELRAALPAEFTAILVQCEVEECEWLLLDRDAERIDDLPTFDWYLDGGQVD